MNIFAQDGFGPADKINEGLRSGVIQGAILSARYRHPDRFAEKVAALVEPGSKLLLDPEYYAARFIASPNAKLGTLEEWPYFTGARRADLIAGRAIEPIIRGALECQVVYERLSGLIAPNIYVEDADSIDAAIALNFIGQTRSVADEMGIDETPVFASLVLDRDVLASGAPFRDFLGALTGLAARPDGFYVLVGSGMGDDDVRHTRSDLYRDDIIAGWMLVNYVLSINGFRVINGCSDLLSPLLGIAGGSAGASGWSSGLRQFTMNRYVRPPSQGGRQPVIRYVSGALLARVKQNELEDYRVIEPDCANGLPSDAYYESGDEDTTRAQEALQTWDALTDLCAATVTGDVAADLLRFEERVAHALALWGALAGAGLSAGVEAQQDRLEAVRAGIRLFREWAELS